jgi:hypothetical protein
VPRQTAAVAVDVQNLARHALLVVGSKGQPVYEREARGVARADVKRPVRGRAHRADRVRSPFGGNAVDGVRGRGARPARVAPEENRLVRKLVGGGELEAQQPRHRRAVPVGGQLVEVVGVEQVDIAVAREARVHGDAEQAAVPVAVHPPGHVEDRRSGGLAGIDDLQAPGLLDDEHPPVRRPRHPCWAGQARGERTLLESGGIAGGAGRGGGSQHDSRDSRERGEQSQTASPVRQVQGHGWNEPPTGRPLSSVRTKPILASDSLASVGTTASWPLERILGGDQNRRAKGSST